jgi:hypothetical protein
MNLKNIFLFGILPLFAVGLFFVNKVNAVDKGFGITPRYWEVCGDGDLDTVFENCDTGPLVGV